ncbi:hypothetical protein ACFRQM_31655 [Streptomyces sp. NPDC056831]|uniref:hypothetical protein n=1 Tax=Streptomyces sp. NPDC056831 TaxID=3345954 RepID=UPI0036AE9972
MHVEHLAQPLDRVGLAVILDEPPAAYQVISEAKDFVAFRRMSRSVARVAFSLRAAFSSASRAWMRASSSS